MCESTINTRKTAVSEQLYWDFLLFLCTQEIGNQGRSGGSDGGRGRGSRGIPWSRLDCRVEVGKIGVSGASDQTDRIAGRISGYAASREWA